MLYIICLISGVLLGLSLNGPLGILPGAIFGVLAIIACQLELINQRLNKQNSSSVRPKK